MKNVWGVLSILKGADHPSKEQLNGVSFLLCMAKLGAVRLPHVDVKKSIFYIRM